MVFQVQTDPISADKRLQTKIGDMDRVQLRMNNFMNPGFEDWSNPHSPRFLSSSGTEEHASFYASSPTYPVSEGSRSLGMFARATNEFNPSESKLTQTSWPYWSNPVNCTLTFDYYLESLPNSSLDYFEIQVRLSSRTMFYYLGSTLSRTNGTSLAYFMISSPSSTWATFSRNVTSDFITVFGFIPTQFQTVYWTVKSYTPKETRVYIDNVVLLNGTTAPEVNGNLVLENGNFESTTGWYLSSASGLGEISQSNDTTEGNWSLNSTVRSGQVGISSYSRFRAPINRRLSKNNQDTFSFNWKVSDWDGATSTTYIYVLVELANSSNEFSVYYVLANGGTLPSLGSEDDYVILVSDYNTTNQWNFFNTSIWRDVGGENRFDIFIEGITFYSASATPLSRLTVLFDNTSLMSFTLEDMSYEEQLEVESPVHSSEYTYNPRSDFTITDFAYTGSKAANLTLVDNYFYNYFQLSYFNFNNNTEWILDMMYYIQDFNATGTETCISIYVSTSEGSINYVLINSSTFDLADYFEDEYFVLSRSLVMNEWINIQLDLYHDFVNLFGAPSEDTKIDYIELYAVSYDDNLTVFFDDFYFYQDSTPSISSVTSVITPPNFDESVAINAKVIDATLDEVVLCYRVDSGSWITLSMTSSGNDLYQAIIPSLPANSFVEYYIIAKDEYNKSSSTDIYSYTVEATSTTTTTTTTTNTDTTNPTTTTTTPSTTSPKANPGFESIFTILILVSTAIIISRRKSG